MPRPEPKMVTFEIDGREVQAPEGAMLVDGAKYGDVEIPYFCYEPKLGQPVGACRMCLVEIEGIPKLQTACSTPVKDGMVVVTTSDKVKQAQNSVVEFLLVNHPLDCPVCDKGGECPLQDISYGWGPGRSRFIEPKRHFKKPLELSPLVAIDRERCILCYRCVRFSQEIAEDHQLVFLERGDHTFVGTHHGHPYVAPFSGNIVELCPVGALTSTAYRFRARPWDIEYGGSICTLCPSQCNVRFTVRDDMKVLRVDTRTGTANEEVDDGWLCDKGRFGYQAIHSEDRITAPLVREGGTLLERSWDLALDRVAENLKKAGAKTAAIVGGQASNEEGFLVQHVLRDLLSSPHVDSRLNPVDAGVARALNRPELTATMLDVEYAGAVLVLGTEPVDEMPILDLRVRKGRRRNGVDVVVATAHPSSLDRDAAAVVRYAPGAEEAFLAALAAALDSPRVPAVGARPQAGTAAPGHGDDAGREAASGHAADAGDAPPEAAASDEGQSEAIGGGEPDAASAETAGERGGEFRGPTGQPADRAAAVSQPAATVAGDPAAASPAGLSPPPPGDAAEDPLAGLARRAGTTADAVRDAAAALRGDGPVVVIWGERVLQGERGADAAQALLAVAAALNLGETEGSGLLEVPAGTNGRGLREVGCLPNLGPGLADAPEHGRDAAGIAAGLSGGELTSLLLVHADPLTSHAPRAAWAEALEGAGFVVAFSDFLDGAVAEHADVILPIESYAERDGTVTHPDGRVQRLRQAIGNPGEVRPAWWALAQIARRLGSDLDLPTAAAVSAKVFAAVPFYEGLTLEEIGGNGVRWQERDAAAKAPGGELPDAPLGTPPEPPEGLRLGTRPSLWTGREVRHAPVLRFLEAGQTVEISPADAERLGVHHGSRAAVGVNGTRVDATVSVRAGMPEGTAFLIEGTGEDNGTALANGVPQVVEVTPA